MNSLSHGNCNGTAGDICPNPCPPRFAKCTSAAEELHPLPCPALLECGTVGTPRIDANTPATAFPIFVASVDIDTTCLCFPNVKIEFSSLINFDLGGNESLTVQLSRTCNNGNKVVLRTFTITPVTAGGGVATLPFSFIHCTQNAPSKNCTYTVEITGATNLEGQEFIQFDNSAIAAFAVGCARIC